MVEKKRPTVGIMIGDVHNEHSNRLTNDIYSAFKKYDIDTHFFLGTEATSYINGTFNENDNDYQYANIYDFNKMSDVDVLICAYGSMHIYHDKEPIEIFRKRFVDVPIVFLESEVECPNSVSITCDNYGGFANLVNHLIIEHEYKKLVLLAGPVNNTDSDERIKAFYDTMKENGLELNQYSMIHGDYSEYVDSQVEWLLDNNDNIDAIVSANDEMTISIYRVLKKRGIEIGKDIAVVGFDDMKLASYVNPPLTTVRQDRRAMAETAADVVMKILSNEEVTSVQIPTEFVKRASCGCKYQKREAKKVKMDSLSGMDIVDVVGEFKQGTHFSWGGPLFVREVFSLVDNPKEMFKTIGLRLQQIGANSSYIVLCERPYECTIDDEFVCPSRMKLCMRQKDHFIESYEEKECPIIKRGCFPRYLIDNSKRQDLLTFLLYDGVLIHGILVVQAEPDQIRDFYIMSLNLSTILTMYNMSLKEKQIREELRRKNEILKFSALHDSLTGLYNRQGAFSTLYEYYYDHDSEEKIFFMADLDHLKQINDTFGHTEGDNAIKVAADILRETFGLDAPIGRAGGDEFCGGYVINSKSKHKKIEDIKDEIKVRCREYNSKSRKPYWVEISLGITKYMNDCNDSMTLAYKRADEMLYEAKKTRKENVIRDF